MKFIKYPEPLKWSDICKRPTLDFEKLEVSISQVMNKVKEDGDDALIEFTAKFDQVNLDSVQFDLSDKKFELCPALTEAIKQAKINIETFHLAQKEEQQKVETMPGVSCWRKKVPIQKVGLYIPGGSAPLFSTLLMLVIPAKLAECKNIVICTPPAKDGAINGVIAWTCQLLGINTVYLAGGAQAIAAMTYGTNSIPKVDKIFGPGNQYVTVAKQLVQKTGIAIDMPAGPSEVLVLADDSAYPEFVAADLLSQAEHGPDSQVVLVSDSETFIQYVEEELIKQVEVLPRKEIAKKALENSQSILAKNLDEAIDFSNEYAPEHLIIATRNNEKLAKNVINAGSVFLGHWSCESAGDYASGTNHTLPTNGYARNYSGVSLDSFTKQITFQKLSKEGIQNLGPTIEKMAEAEQLQAHKHAVTIRLNEIENV